MPGSKPGERRGGRPRGGLHKSTHEALHRERIEEQLAPTPVEAAREGALPAVAGEIANAVNAPRRKLAKEHLEDLLEIAVGCVAHYQPCVLSGTPNANENLDRFKDWFRIASDLAMKLAHFQSPTYRAIAVMAACEASVRPRCPNSRTTSKWTRPHGRNRRT